MGEPLCVPAPLSPTGVTLRKVAFYLRNYSLREWENQLMIPDTSDKFFSGVQEKVQRQQLPTDFKYLKYIQVTKFTSRATL